MTGPQMVPMPPITAGTIASIETVDPKACVGPDEEVVLRVVGAGDGGDDAAERDRDQPVAHHADPERLGRGLVVAHGLDALAGAASW